MEDLVQAFIGILAVVVLGRIATLLSRAMDLPSAPVQIFIGILLGPSLLNLSGLPILLGTWGSPSPGLLHGALKALAEIGLIQLMFLAGLNTDWRQVKSNLRSVISIGSWNSLAAAAGAVLITRVYGQPWPEALAMGAVMAASSFGISAHSCTPMRPPGPHPVSLILGASLASGCLAVLLMTASLAARYMASFGAFKMIIAASWFLGKLTMFWAVSYFLTSRFLARVAKPAFDQRPRQKLVGYLLLVASLYAWAAMHFGGFAAVGVASLGGGLLAVSSPGLKEKISRGLESGLASLPVGVFCTVLGFGVDLRGKEVEGLFTVSLFALAGGAKFIGGWFPTREALDLTGARILATLGTLPQGEMGILIATYLFSRRLVSLSQFNAAISVVLILTMLAPVAIRVSSRGMPFQNT